MLDNPIFLLQKFIPNIDDTIIAIASAIVLFIIPANRSGEPLIKWNEAVRIPWGIILLFGGGIAIAKGFQDTGLATYLGGQMTFFDGLPLFVLLLLVITCVNFLTEVTSNLATTAMMLPVLAPLALTLSINPYLLMVACTSAASCAFMLPVATPPNAVVLGLDIYVYRIWFAPVFNEYFIDCINGLSCLFFLPIIMDFV